MSLSADRQEIAEIFSSVEKVKGFKFRPTVMNPGNAWSLLERLKDPYGDNFQAVWRGIVVLPPGEKAAMEWFEDKYEVIAQAFIDSGWNVDAIEPGPVMTEAGDIDAMILTLRREA